MMSGTLICCRPCVMCFHRRRIRREHEEKLRQKAFARAQEKVEAAKREEEEARLREAVQQELARHTKHQGANTKIALPAGMVPEDVRCSLCRCMRRGEPAYR